MHSARTGSERSSEKGAVMAESNVERLRSAGVLGEDQELSEEQKSVINGWSEPEIRDLSRAGRQLGLPPRTPSHQNGSGF